MNYRCTIEFEPKHPEAVYNALNSTEKYERSTSSVHLKDKKIFIEVRANDIAALRASVNDFMRLCRVCEIEKYGDVDE